MRLPPLRRRPRPFEHLRTEPLSALRRPLTPVERIEDIIERVRDAVDSEEIPDGAANSLTNQLMVVTALLNDRKTTPAIAQLEAFITKVEAQRGEQIPAPDAAALIAAARAVIASLE